MFEELFLYRRLEEEMDFLFFILVEEEVEDKNEFILEEFFIFVLKNIVFFFNNVIFIMVGCDKLIKVINKVYDEGCKVVVFFQKDMDMEDFFEGDLYWIGIVVYILKFLKMFDGMFIVIL